HEGSILSTLGSKSLSALTAVRDYAARLWVRVLPAEGTIEHCRSLGFPETHILLGKGPFTIEQNVQHIRQSGAGLLVTKESGSTGGYPEKLAAAKQCGIPVVTLLRESETGYTLEEIKAVLQTVLCKPL
ncbi:MAG: precorrin-6A/cobalt-precorrin-6A reductase, partial [Oscillospiraceae bacterium]|nr:precorrin-6A/cobalt-precorrin-6A reductase [Oscillospiraceae bacterium]